MERSQSIFTFVLVSFIFLLPTGCRQQSAVAPNIDQKAELPAETTRDLKPLTKDSKSTIDNRKSEIQKPSPSISFEKTAHNFGELGIREKGECEFKFKNTGQALLRIGKIRSTCGCAVPSLPKTEYEPGEEGVIKVKYSGQSKLGPMAKSIFVPSNDRKNPKVKLTIRAKVVQQVEVAPRKFQLSLGKENAGMPKITLRSGDGRAFSIKGYAASNGLVKVGFDRNMSASEFILEPRVDMDKLKKHRRGMIKIDLTHPACSSVALFYEVAAKFQAQPSKITLHNIEPNEPQTKEVVIKNTDKQRFEIESASSRQGYIKVISQELNGDNIKLKLQITPPPRGGKRGHFSDSLSIKIKSDEEELAIPCSGFYHRRLAKAKATKS